MAINTQKLLPSSRGSSIVKAKITRIPADKISISGKKGKSFEIKTKVIEIDKILKGTLAANKKELSDKKKEIQETKREKGEKKLEEKSVKKKGKKKSLQLPKMGFFDRIKNFVGNIFLGFLAVRLIDFLPQLEFLIPKIGTALDWFSDAVIGFLDGFGTFLVKVEDAYLWTEDYIKDKFGEDALKNFQGFVSKLEQFLNLSLIIGMATAAIGSKLKSDKKDKKPRVKKPKIKFKPSSTKASRKRYQRRFGADAAKKKFKGKVRPNVFQRVFKGIRNKYDSAVGAVGNQFKKIGKATQELLVRRLVDPIRPVLDPIVKTAQSIGDNLIKRLQSIPGIGSALKKAGMNSLADAPKLAAKFGAKALPIIGGIFNLLFAYDRFANGDATGGIIETISAALDFSGVGAPLSMALDAYMFTRDLFPETFIGAEDNIIDNLRLTGLKNKVSEMTKKLPDLSDIVKMMSGDKDKGGVPSTPVNPDVTKSASNLSGELGKYIQSKLSSPKDYQAITEHPDFGGVRGRHAKNSYHYSGRAIDIGAWDYEQGPILNVIKEFSEKRGINPVELIHAGNDPKGHGDHVHVAYAKGGFIDGLTFAMLGEKGREFVFDADTTKALEDNVPGFLSALNKADYNSAMAVLRNYASYEGNQIQIIPVPVPVGGSSGTQSQGSSMVSMSGGVVMKESDWKESLYMGG
jgi:hypothetical protein